MVDHTGPMYDDTLRDMTCGQDTLDDTGMFFINQ